MIVFAGETQRLTPQASTAHLRLQAHDSKNDQFCKPHLPIRHFYITDLSLKPWVIIGSVLPPITVVVEQLHSGKDVLHPSGLEPANHLATDSPKAKIKQQFILPWLLAM